MSLHEDPLINDWLLSVKKSTAKQYEFHFSRFLEYFDISAQQLKDEAKNNKAQIKKKFNVYNRSLVEKADYSAHTSRLAINSIKSFLKYHEVPIKTTPIKTPRKYRREVIRAEDIKLMISAAKEVRDKALIMMAFQCGMSISDLVKLNYEQVKSAVENEEISHCIFRYIRGKASTEAIAIIGSDSLKFLRQYIKERTIEGEKIEDESPLFLKSQKYAGSIRFGKRGAMDKIKEAAILAGLMSEKEVNKSAKSKVNPWGFHAIRKAFSSIASKRKLPLEQREMSMGHKVAYDGAYAGYHDEELIEEYKKVEPYLSITEMAPPEPAKPEGLQVMDMKLFEDMLQVLLEIKEGINRLSKNIEQTLDLKKWR